MFFNQTVCAQDSAPKKTINRLPLIYNSLQMGDIMLEFYCFRKKKTENRRKPEVYSALEAARHIINYANQTKRFISALKLQKILYFVQAEFLISQGRLCFADDIEAWDFGPVVPAVLHEFLRFGSCFIPPVIHYFIDDENAFFGIRKVEFRDCTISDEDKAVINEVVDYLADYSAVDLTDLTQKQKPWIDAYCGYCRNIIPTDTIRSYFADRKDG